MLVEPAIGEIGEGVFSEDRLGKKIASILEFESLSASNIGGTPRV